MSKLLKTIGLIGLIALGSKTADALENKVKDNYDVKKSTATFEVEKSTEAKKGILRKLEFELGAGIQSNAKNPAQDYINGVNQDFRDGKYTFSTPINGWRDIKTNNPAILEPEISVLYKSDKFKIGPCCWVKISTRQV